MTALNQLISVDDHVIEPTHIWETYLPAKLRGRGPRFVVDDHGPAWVFEGNRSPLDSMGTGGATWPVEDRPPMFTPLSWDQVPEACYDPAARVKTMDANGVLAAVCFPNMAGFCGSMFQKVEDKELALACIQAYNTWFLEEWVNAFPGRFIGLGMVPMWDGKLAAAEAERIIGLGARTITFSQGPHSMGLPRIADTHWNPLFSVLNDANLPLCTHLGTGMQPQRDEQGNEMAKKMREAMESGKDFQTVMREMMKNNDLVSIAEKAGISGEKSWQRRRDMLPGTSTSLLGAKMGQETLTEWLESGQFEKFPNLKLALSENGIGWIPATLWMVDWTEELNRMQHPSDAPLPSTLFRDHVYGCFIHEPVTPQLIEQIGEDNIMIETDFPHTATNGPYTIERAQKCMESVPESVQHKIMRGNAERLFDFVPTEPAQAVAV